MYSNTTYVDFTLLLFTRLDLALVEGRQDDARTLAAKLADTYKDGTKIGRAFSGISDMLDGPYCDTTHIRRRLYRWTPNYFFHP